MCSSTRWRSSCTIGVSLSCSSTPWSTVRRFPVRQRRQATAGTARNTRAPCSTAIACRPSGSIRAAEMARQRTYRSARGRSAGKPSGGAGSAGRRRARRVGRPTTGAVGRRRPTSESRGPGADKPRARRRQAAGPAQRRNAAGGPGRGPGADKPRAEQPAGSATTAGEHRRQWTHIPESSRIDRARADMSSSPWPFATRPFSNCAARPVTGSDAPASRARSSAIARSLRCRLTLKPSG